MVIDIERFWFFVCGVYVFYLLVVLFYLIGVKIGYFFRLFGIWIFLLCLGNFFLYEFGEDVEFISFYRVESVVFVFGLFRILEVVLWWRFIRSVYCLMVIVVRLSFGSIRVVVLVVVLVFSVRGVGVISCSFRCLVVAIGLFLLD